MVTVVNLFTKKDCATSANDGAAWWGRQTGPANCERFRFLFNRATIALYGSAAGSDDERLSQRMRMP